jgi:hypothetical protein
MEVAEALMDCIRDDPEPPLQEAKAADAADAPPSGEDSESHIMDPPTPTVVGGAVVSDCVAGKSTAEARPLSPLAYSAEMVFDLPRCPSVYSAKTVFDLPLPMAEVVLPIPQVNAGVEVPLGAMPPMAQASTSNYPRKFGWIGKNILGLHSSMARMSISQGAPSLSQRSTSSPHDVVENSTLTHQTASAAVPLA